MGNQESNTQGQIDADEFLAQFDTVKKFQDPRFGDSTLVEHKENKQQCIIRELNSTDQEDHENNLRKYQAKMQLQHPNIIKLVTVLNKTDAQFCSTFYKTYLIFEYVSNSIEKEIMVRRPQQNFFSEGEIWNTMGGVIQGLAFLQKNNIPQGTIRVGTIYFSEEGQPKITDPTTFQQLNNFATVCSDKDKVPSSVYLAPKLLDALEDGDWQPQHNEYKSDVFSLGMSLISMGLLEYCDDCYDYSNYKFFPQKLEDKLVQFSQRYTQDLTQFIMLMLKIEEEHRLDFIQLEDILISQPTQQPDDQVSPQKQIPSYNASPNINTANNIKQKTQEINTLFQSNHQQQPQQLDQQQEEQLKHAGHTKVSSMLPPEQQQPYLPNNQNAIEQQPPQQVYERQLSGQKQHNFSSPQGNKVQSQRESQPAQFMHEDQPDSGATNMFAPKETISEICKPDENQGNEIGAGTYRDEDQSPYKEEEIQQQQQIQYQQQEPQQYQQSYQQYQQQQQQYIPQQEPVQQQQSSEKKYEPYQPQKQYQQVIQQQQQQEMPKHSSYQPQQQQQQKQQYTYIRAINEPLSNSKKEEPSNTQIINQQYVAQNQEQQQQQQIPQYQVDSQINNIINKYSPTRDSNVKQSESKEVPPAPTTTTSYTTYQQYQPYSTSPEKKEYKPYNPYQASTTTTVISNNQYYPATTTTIAGQQQQQQQPGTTTTTTTYIQPSSTTQQEVKDLTNQFQQKATIQQEQHPISTTIQQEQQPHTTITTTTNNYQQQQVQQEQGYTVETYQNGSRYEGEKLNNMRHGKGKFYYQDNGGLYDGEWVYNKMHGKGVLFYASGKPAYDGAWQEDKFEGFGILYNEKPEQLSTPFDYKDFDQVEEYWTKYDGEFKDDYKEGYGTLYIANGEKFSGTFKRDFVQGTGTYHCLNGEKITGVWYNNKFQPQ